MQDVDDELSTGKLLEQQGAHLILALELRDHLYRKGERIAGALTCCRGNFAYSGSIRLRDHYLRDGRHDHGRGGSIGIFKELTTIVEGL